VKPHKKKTKRTQTETIIIQDCKEQHAIVTNVEAQTESIPVCNKDVQTEAFPSSITIDQTVHEKESQTIRTICHNKEIQVDLQSKNVMENDPRIVKLQKELA